VETVKTQRFLRRKHLGWDRVHFHHPRAGWVPEVRGMSLPDNSIRFLNSIGCIAEPIGDGRYIIGRHPRAAACAVKFLGCIFDAETKFPETPATLGFNLSGRNLMLSPADLDQPIECPDEK
jgi:hypothetical protein